MRKKRSKTLDQVAAMKDRAVRFVRDVLDDPDRADEIESEDPRDYAARKRITVLENPSKRRNDDMARRQTREELEGRIDELEDEVGALNEKLNSIADIAAADDAEEDDGEEDDEED